MNLALMILGLIEQALPAIIALATTIENSLGGASASNPATPIVKHLQDAHAAVQDAKTKV